MISTPAGSSKSPAVNLPVPDFSTDSSASSTSIIRTAIPFKFKSMFITSSATPSIVENSCNTPSIFASATHEPGIEDRIILLKAFPNVWPNPLSKGSNIIFE